MFKLFTDSLKRMGDALASCLLAGPGKLSLRRTLMLILLIPVFVLWQGVNWLCLLLDEVIFPGYRSVAIRKPVFVLGVPRSGTTFLHKVLAEDERYTTFSVWECLFAPSIIQKKLVRGVAVLDAAIGAPLARLLTWVSTKALAGLDDIHEMGLSEPEEDYLALLPIFACFILIVPFPEARALWRVGAMDRTMPRAERDRIAAFYRAILQKHLYVYGREKTLLSKNASFAGFARTLKETCPDGKFLVCVRDPIKVVPSQLSSLEGGFALLGSQCDAPAFNSRMSDLLLGHYLNLIAEFGEVTSSNHAWVRQADLKARLEETITSVYERMDLPMSAAFAYSLGHNDHSSRKHVSGHAYTLADFGLTEADIHRRFAEVYETLPLSFDPKKPSDTKTRSANIEDRQAS